MRILVSLSIALSVFTTVAQPLPLTMKEVALMLRSGYSSETVLQEMASRRVSEPLDESTRKALVEFGASPQLIDALGNGTFLVSEAEAEKARAEAANAALEQEKATEKIYRDATEILKAQHAQASAAGGLNGAAFVNSLKAKLVVCHNGAFGAIDTVDFEKKKLIVLYFSAHWCAPCRKFTPQLVDYYNQVEPLHPEFEVIFVSCDRSRFNWETYIRDTAMPWPAVDYDQLGPLAGLKQIAGDGIPSLVLLDAAGRILSSSYEGEKYLGPEKVIGDLNKIFAQGGNPGVASSR